MKWIYSIMNIFTCIARNDGYDIFFFQFADVLHLTDGSPQSG